MFYAEDRGVPWHKLGKGVETAQTSAKAIQLAGLSKWNMHLEEFSPRSVIEKLKPGEVPTYAEEWRAIVRGLDNKVLGVATESYKPIQNEQMFEFMDSLVADGIMVYETAGSLMGGRKVWLLARLANDVRIGNDRYVEYLLLVAGHDNFTSLRIYPTKVRVVCFNTLMQATRRTPEAVRIVHSGNLERKFEAARAVLNVTTEAQRRMTEWMEKLAREKLSEDSVTTIQEKIFGTLDEETPARRREAIEKFRSIYEAEQAREGRTSYAVLQAVTGYGDHMINLRQRKDGEERLRSVLSGGSGLLFKQKGIAALAAASRVAVPSGLFASGGD